MASSKVFIAGFVAVFGLTFVPIYFYPKMNRQNIIAAQKVNRKDIVQEEVQPGNMKIWSDPFDRKKE